MKKPNTWYGKAWYFIWEEDSALSWIVNIILAYVLIRFLLYPGIGLLLNTSYPVVAVVSDSMEHKGATFDIWWDQNGAFYAKYNITKEQFQDYAMNNGFNKGDIIFLRGKNPKDTQKGDIIVFMTNYKNEPIIHRVIKKNNNIYQTKGDHNTDSGFFEMSIQQQDIIGVAAFRIPWLGYVKIWFSQLISIF